MKESFVHLHVHSYYSLMQGVSSLDTLCRETVKVGLSCLALTDTHGFYGIVNFLEEAGKHKLRPIIGACFNDPMESAVILAKTPTGYEILSDMITQKHLEKDFSLAGNLPPCRGHLTVMSSCADLLKSLRARTECYVEVVPGPGARKALHMALSMDLPPVATNAVHFAYPADYHLHRLVRAIDLNCTLSTLPSREMVSPDRWLKPPRDMENHFPGYPQAVANTVKLAGECWTDWERCKTVFPRYRDEGRDHFALLRNLCRRGIRRRYGPTSEPVETRLTEELELIREKGYVDYFLVVADMVRRRPIHCGRGSAAASLVSYLLGITHVDPIQHNLFFGRFLNPQRVDHPDIDVDFPWDERDGLLEELIQYYGPQRLAMVANHVGFKARGAVREVAKVYGIPAAEIKEVTRRMGFGTRPGSIRKRFESHPKFRGFSLDPPWPEIFDLAVRLEGIPRHLSVHCGGVILAPDKVSRHVPVQMASKGIRVIQWEKDQTEEAGLVKIDLLGNRSLAVIRDTLTAVRENAGVEIDYAGFDPIHDPATVDLLGRGDTMGVFYVESPAMRQLQQKTRRGDFEHLVIHSSIIRPAANRYIREYVKRLHGAPYKPIHSRLGRLLDETYGIMVYQEDVVRVAMALAGFDWIEADGLRKILSKKSPNKLLRYREHFFQGCARRDIPGQTVEAVWDMIISFAGYSFCKPHSASYALVSFKSAYLKLHYPAEFMAAVISNGGGYYTTFAYISEARRMGLTVLGPDINQSDRHYRGKGKMVRMGFQQLQAIRRETLEEIISERERNGPFISLEEFLERTALTPADGAVLAKSGALDSLAGGLNRPQLLWMVEAWCREHPRHRGKTGVGLTLIPSRRVEVPPLQDVDRRRIWSQEEETLGFMLSAHPLTRWDTFIQSFPHTVVRASDLAGHIGRRVWVSGWPITRKEVLTREGEQMEFVSFEDQSAIYETVFFPEAFQRFCREVDMNRPYLLYGRVESEFEAVSLTVEQVRRVPLEPSAPGGLNQRAFRNGKADRITA